MAAVYYLYYIVAKPSLLNNLLAELGCIKGRLEKAVVLIVGNRMSPSRKI